MQKDVTLDLGPKETLTEYLRKNPDVLRKFLKENWVCGKCKHWLDILGGAYEKKGRVYGICEEEHTLEYYSGMGNYFPEDFGCIFWERRGE